MNYNLYMLVGFILLFFQSENSNAQKKDTIRANFYFGDIAKKHNISKEELRCANLDLKLIRDEKYNKLRKGFELKVPSKISLGKHLIVPGDNPNSIAKTYKISKDELQKLNSDYKPLIEKGNVNRCDILTVPIVDNEKGIKLGKVTTASPTVTKKTNVTTPKVQSFYQKNIQSSQDKKYLICKLNTSEFNIEIFNKKKEGGVHDIHSIQQLKKRDKNKLLFAINGGMFERNREPVGLLIQQGKKMEDLDLSPIGKGNFYSFPPNGVFAIDKNSRAIVVSTNEFREKHARTSNTFKLATQSGPMMVINGKFNKAFNKGSKNKHIRNAVGVTQKGEIVFVISKVPVNFYEFSKLLRDELGCSNALYLDGAVSQAWFRDKNQLISVNHNEMPIGPILTVSKK